MPILHQDAKTEDAEREMDAIRSMPEAKARTILIALCDDEGIRRRVFELSRQLGGPGDPSRSNEAPVCARCNERVDPENNGSDACRFHPGNFELDWEADFWADESRHSEDIDQDPTSREDLPEGFKWSCCEMVGRVEGCVRAAHAVDLGSGKGGGIPDEKGKVNGGNHRDEERGRGGDAAVLVLGEGNGNKRKAEEIVPGTDGHRVKKGAGGYGLGPFG